MTFGMSPKTFEMIQSVFRLHPEIKQVKIFGSRVLETYRDNSDIDLVIYNDIDETLLANVAAQLDELPLPYLFDIKVYSHITNIGLHEHIDKFAKDIYLKEEQ